LFSRGMRDDLQPCLERVFALDEFECCRPAAEKRSEKVGKVAVHPRKGVAEPRSSFSVEVGNALAEFGDGLDQVVPVRHRDLEMPADFLDLPLRSKVDAAQTLAFGLEPVQFLLDVCLPGEGILRLYAGGFGGSGSRDFQGFRYLALDLPALP